MKLTVVAIIFAVSAMAQTKHQIPKCAIPCMQRAIKANTKCAFEDFKCICKDRSKAFDHAAIECVIDACGKLQAIRKSARELFFPIFLVEATRATNGRGR